MENLKFIDNRLYILDQTLLPNEEKLIEITNKEQAYNAIKTLMVRGAPAIGIFAGYAMALFSESNNIYELKKYFDSSRPTAVNLSRATERIVKAYEHGKSLIDEAAAIQHEDIEMCRKISEYGLSLLKDGDGIITHCNAGELAASKYGTGLGPLLLGKEKGYAFRVFCDETRPLLQGARLTSYELEKAGIDVTLICDNTAGSVMKKGLINAVLTGCDRVAANGDTANKTGTSSLAVLAKYYNVPFYVLGPCSTVDFSCKTGDDIVIEERDGEEIKEKYFENPTALKQTKCYNPAFDVTDSSLITAIITDKGIVYPPFEVNLKKILTDNLKGHKK